MRLFCLSMIFVCGVAHAQGGADGASAIAAGIEAYEQANLEEARTLMEHAADANDIDV